MDGEMIGTANVLETSKGRPRSLKSVAMWERIHGDADSFLREFLDEFYVEQDRCERATMLAEEPPLSDNERLNAYLAAVAEHLALRYRLDIPDWVLTPPRFLKRPFFSGRA